MITSMGKGIIQGEPDVEQIDGKHRFLLHFWTDNKHHVLDLDAEAFESLCHLRDKTGSLDRLLLTVKDRKVTSDGELVASVPEMKGELKVLARIARMAWGTPFMEKAEEYIRAANGDTKRLVEVADALQLKIMGSS